LVGFAENYNVAETGTGSRDAHSLTGAAIHFTFTSLTLAYDLRRADAIESVRRMALA
jgi:hypothetical protein